MRADASHVEQVRETLEAILALPEVQRSAFLHHQVERIVGEAVGLVEANELVTATTLSVLEERIDEMEEQAGDVVADGFFNHLRDGLRVQVPTDDTVEG